MKDFAIAVVTEDHSRIEAALSDARAGPAAHSLLPELFACLALALPDSHLSDRYSAALISTINSICRNCSEERKGSAGALKGLERATRNADADIRAHAVSAASILGTPDALRFMLRMLEDRETCRVCLDPEEHISDVVGLIFSVSPGDAILELGRMLPHPSPEVRMYAAGSLLMFGRPGSPPRLAEAAHRMLRDAMVSGSEEAQGFFSQGRNHSAGGGDAPRSPRARKIAEATRAFYERFPELHKLGSGGPDGSMLRRNARLRVVGGCNGHRVPR